MMRFIAFLFSLSLLTACSSDRPLKQDKKHSPLHSGVVLEGKYFHIEVVGTHKEVKIYPYETDETTNSLRPMDTRKIKLSVQYSPYRSKADYSTYMVRKKDHFWGEIKDKSKRGYQIYTKLKYDGHTDRFIYMVKPVP